MHDIGAFLGEGAGDGETDARGRAGDEGDFAFEHDISDLREITAKHGMPARARSNGR